MGERKATRFDLALAQLACRYAREPDVVIRSLYVSAIVGTVLNLINQGDAIISGSDIDYAKLVLTYLVPYFIGTYGAVSVRLRDRKQAQKA